MAAKKQQNNPQVNKVEATESSIGHLDLRPAELFAAASYMIDIHPNGCFYHAWRVGLVAECLASALVPDEADSVFYAGLMADVGTVGAYKHITHYTSLQKQMDEPLIRSHPHRGAAVLDWLPGMSNAAKIVRSHHEWWDGRGYPDNRVAKEIPIGSQILLIAETMDAAGCFASSRALVDGLRSLAVFTGHSWNSDIWAAAVNSVEDSDFYTALMDPISLPRLMAECLAKHKLPTELDSEEGVERIFHIFAMLIDAKDPSTSGHSLRVARLAKGLSEHMGLSADELCAVYWAGLVHDCGRLGVPTMILERWGRLNEEEMSLVQKHAQMTMHVMSCLPTCPDMATLGSIAGHDHEHYDGTGYPDRLKGENIHLLSRILCVADAFDAMTSATSYKHLLSSRFALIRLKQSAGTQFDPNIVDTMVSAVEGGMLATEQTLAA